MNIEMTVSITGVISTLTSIAALAAAIYIGFVQNKINKQMCRIQDSIDVYLRIHAVFSESDPSELLSAKVAIYNISTLPLTLEKYNFNGVVRQISPYRIPSTMQFSDAYYYINLPHVSRMNYSSFTLFFEDAVGRKWTVEGKAEYQNEGWQLSWNKPVMVKGSSK